MKTDDKKKYAASRSLNISISDSGKFIANNSLSKSMKEVNLDLLLIINAFLTPLTFSEGHKKLCEFYNISKTDLNKIIKHLLHLNILTVKQINSKKFVSAEIGFASLAIHHNMLMDTTRVLAYKTAISTQVNGKSVIDLGCGTGILSLFAAKSGAKKIIAIEETNIALVAEKMFKSNRINHLVTLYKSNSKNVNIAQKADILIHEILGTDPLDENILMYISDAKKRFLKKGGKLIPGKLTICCIGYEEDLHSRLENDAINFENLYGVSFKSYIQDIKRTPLHSLAGNLQVGKNEFYGKKIITEEVILYDFDFNLEIMPVFNRQKIVNLKINGDGVLTGLLIYFKAQLSDEIALSTSPYSKPTHWGQKNNPFLSPRIVKKETAVKLKVCIKNINGKHKTDIELV